MTLDLHLLICTVIKNTDLFVVDVGSFTQDIEAMLGELERDLQKAVSPLKEKGRTFAH